MAVKPQTANPNPNPTGTGDGDRNDGDGNRKGITARKINNQQKSDRRLHRCSDVEEFENFESRNSIIKKREVKQRKGFQVRKSTSNHQISDRRLHGVKEFKNSEPRNSIIKKREVTQRKGFQVKKSTSDQQIPDRRLHGVKEFEIFEPRNSIIKKREVTQRKGFQVKKSTTNQQISDRRLHRCSDLKEFEKCEPRNSFIKKREDTKNSAIKFPAVVKNSSVGKEKTSAKSSSEKPPISFIMKKKKKRVKKILNKQTSDLIHPTARRGCRSDKEFEELELRIEKEMQRTRLVIVMQLSHFLQLKAQWKAARASKLALRRSTETKAMKKKITTCGGEKGDGLDDHGIKRTDINSVIKCNSNKRGGCSQRNTVQKRRRSSNFDKEEDSRKKKERKEEDASNSNVGSATAHKERMAKVRKDGASNVGSTSGNRIYNWTFGKYH